MGPVLIFGPDTGLVAERAEKLVTNASTGNEDPFSLVKLDASGLVSDPNRLIDEVLTIPLFGGKRVIWVKDASGKNLIPAVEAILKPGNCPATVVIEGGDLKKGTGLRKLFETNKHATAIPCYADNDRGVDILIDQETREANVSISREARTALHALLGADRLASRGELKKLCLYAFKKGRIETGDIEAIIGDASALETSELIDAAATGDVAGLDHGLERLTHAGSKATILANQTLKHFQSLHRMRADVDSGKSVRQVVESQRPPIFFSRRPSIIRQLSVWSSKDTQKAMELLSQATSTSRRNDELSVAIVSDVLLTLSRVAKSRSNRGHA
nr:DNA polymerase III subunit delta [Roseibium hamelinense]